MPTLSSPAVLLIRNKVVKARALSRTHMEYYGIPPWGYYQKNTKEYYPYGLLRIIFLSQNTKEYYSHVIFINNIIK